MVFKSIIGATCTCLAVVSFNTNAALLGRLSATPGGTDYQAYYDTDADLTWLADANALGHLLRWTGAMTWATGIDVAGITGWRLPDTLQPDAGCDEQTGVVTFGYNCTGSEMGNLFYNVLGNTAGSLTNSGPFSNVQSDYYWSATVHPTNTGAAGNFNMANGYQRYDNMALFNYAWAVHDGDVGETVVPIPSAVWLFGSGLIGLIGLARRKTRI